MLHWKEKENIETDALQSVPLATSPKPLSSKYSFGLVKIIQIQYIL